MKDTIGDSLLNSRSFGRKLFKSSLGEGTSMSIAFGPATKGSLGIYYDRWRALHEHIDKLRDSYEKYPNPFPRRNAILNLLKSLQVFSKGQFEFFYRGFDPAAQPAAPANHLRLQVWDAFPPEDVLTGILLQVQNDLDLIQRAATQRIFGDKNARDTLDYADQLAWLALQPAIDAGVIDEPTIVLTHFQKSAEFYTIPYANVALIAIPFTCTSRSTCSDFLSIPHEVGHYVYRHPTQAIQDALNGLRLAPPVDPQYQGWVKAIFEEMCADIYGCLVAGPVMALDFQGLSLANSQADFQGGDGEHPNPALRPLVYCEVLASPLVDNLVKGNWKTVSEKLARGWNQQLLMRHLDTFVLKGSSSAAQPASQPAAQPTVLAARPYVVGRLLNISNAAAADSVPSPLAKVIRGVVDKMLAQVQAFIQKDPNKAKTILTGWTKVDENTDPDKLLDDFCDNFDKLLALPKKPLPPDPDPLDVRSWKEWLGDKNDKIAAWNHNDPLPSGEVKNPDLMEPNTWGYILYANGWTVSGPSGDNAGHPSGDNAGHPEV
jgi:hypothetical protein